MVKQLRRLLVFLIGLPVALGDATPRDLPALVRARELLGAESWSTVLQLEPNRRGGAGDSALVFEFAGALWFYRPVDGTQSLSQHWNNVAAERGRLLELLQAIDPAWSAYREYSESELATLTRHVGELPNGCFIESAAEARRLTRESKAVDGCLLSYYVKTKDGLRGHTVLCYENASGAHVYDPAEGRAKAVRSVSLRVHAMDLARRIVPGVLGRGLAKAAKIALR